MNEGDTLLTSPYTDIDLYMCSVPLTLEDIAEPLVVHLGRTIEHVATLCQGIREIFRTLRLSGTRRASWSAPHLEV